MREKIFTKTESPDSRQISVLESHPNPKSFLRVFVTLPDSQESPDLINPSQLIRVFTAVLKDTVSLKIQYHMVGTVQLPFPTSPVW